MDDTVFISKTVDFVKNKLASEGSGHDWWHIYRVWKTAIKIAEMKVQIAFLLNLVRFSTTLRTGNFMTVMFP